jgi:DNA-binding IclR family transcriptional regulator
MVDRAQSSWDRLQGLLESLTPGDEVHVATAARQTGLPAATCETVLEALTRVDLFTRVGDHTFLRRRMLEILDQPQVRTMAADQKLRN